MKFDNLGVIGGGAWGTALAMQATLNHASALLYCREEEVACMINRERRSNMLGVHVELPELISATCSLKDLSACDLLLLSIPSQAINNFVQENAGLGFAQPLLLCSKGIDNHSVEFLTDIVTRYWRTPIAVLAGPNFADEIILGKISAATVAAEDGVLANRIINTFSHPKFYIDQSDDIYGVQLLGTCKNAIAITTGISMGLDLGDNCRATILTNGIREARSLLMACGCDEETMWQYAGIGDLVLTAYSLSSRNTSFGYELGQKGATSHTPESIEQLAMFKTTEGYHSCAAIAQLAIKHGLQLPLLQGLYEILYRGAPVMSITTVLG